MTGGYGGRKLFVGGLPPKVDEKALRDVFSRFWHIEEGRPTSNRTVHLMKGVSFKRNCGAALVVIAR